MSSLFKILSLVKKIIIIFLVVLVAATTGAKVGYSKTYIQEFLDNTSDAELQKIYDDTVNKIETIYKPQAIGIWQSKWFQAWLLEALKVEKVLDVKGLLVCTTAPDPCPFKWVCENNGISDGPKTPTYPSNKGQKI